ncbi:hypothetical protein [Mycoplasma suis]|uniref:Uncharacterized protein n=1 Tax=Mycoplasma suis (strain Illinois) TaxID=768700 RepID=F0QQH8_MYCSL|nr:hypothetical protein [Mycoplasma suis]ADX97748.1 hypothetical protein MSU_0204 [Mycoplasma suis str. Illinois]
MKIIPVILGIAGVIGGGSFYLMNNPETFKGFFSRKTIKEEESYSRAKKNGKVIAQFIYKDDYFGSSSEVTGTLKAKCEYWTELNKESRKVMSESECQELIEELPEIKNGNKPIRFLKFDERGNFAIPKEYFYFLREDEDYLLSMLRGEQISEGPWTCSSKQKIDSKELIIKCEKNQN